MVEVVIQSGKISCPRLSGVYPRTRLFNRLDDCRRRPVVWIKSPPGAGKTTLVGSYLMARNLATLWYQIDDGDMDIASFFYYMGHAAKKATPRKRKHLPLFTPEFRQGIKTFSRNYFTALYQRFSEPFCLVFDNYQDVAEDSVLHEVLSEAIETLPEVGNIIIISRAELPSSFVRPLANSLIEMLEWEQLKLTEAEILGLAELRNDLSESTIDVEVLMDMTQGWAAGLVLLLEQGGKDTFPTMHDNNIFSDKLQPGAVFDYFAGVVFEQIDTGIQQFLLKTSFLPKMTVKMANDLTSDRKAGQYLDYLTHKNFFTICHGAKKPVFQYHPMFREFLQARAIQSATQVELTVTRWNAARVLQQDQQIEAAIELLQLVEDWERIAEIIKTNALTMTDQGRHTTLLIWLNIIPADIRNKDAWLLYWYGTVIYPAQPDESLNYFSLAFDVFRQEHDAEGVYLAWASGTEASRTGREAEVKSLDYWLEVLDVIRQEFPEFPSAYIETRVAMVMNFAIVWRNPQHPDRELWRDRVITLLPKVESRVLRCETLAYMAANDLIIGNDTEAGILLDSAHETLPLEKMTPIAKTVMYLAEGFYLWRSGQTSAAVESVYRWIEFNRTGGVHLWDEVIYGHGASGALTEGNREVAGDILQHYSLNQNDLHGYRTAYYLYIYAWYLYTGDELLEARKYLDIAMKSATESGTVFFECLVHYAMANLLYDMGEKQSAKKELDSTLERLRDYQYSNTTFMCLILKAWFALQERRTDQSLCFIREAMALGREKNYMNYSWWRNEVIAEVCGAALEANIETAYVQKLINKRKIIPLTPPFEIETWPWPVKIYSFGGCRLHRDNAAIKFGRKTPQKSIDLVRILLANGCQGVSEERITDALWPDDDADAAYRALSTTLHRTRKILSNEAILLHQGQLSLNQEIVWTDVQAFEYSLIKADKAEKQGDKAEQLRLIEKALSLYKGHFLAQETSLPWAVATREKFRNKFLSNLVKLGKLLAESERQEEAIDWYLKGLEIDPLAEQFYQGLMFCYQQLDRKGDAVAIYRQCLRVLSANLGVEPSIVTRALYKRLG